MATAPLEYAPRPPLTRRRTFRRIVGVLLVLGAVWIGWRYGPWAWGRASLLHAQWQCRTYSMPADQVVFDTDPQTVAALAKHPDYAIVGQCAWRTPPRASWQLNVPQVVTGPAPIVARSRGEALIFLHERRSPDGNPHIVYIDRTAGADASPYFLQCYDVNVRVFSPASWRRDSVQEWPQGWSLDVLDGVGPHQIRIYAGQPDPADASHFTIRYESQGKSGVVDGYVRNGGQVDLHRRRDE